METTSALVALPPEVLKIIASYFSPQDASALSLTCRSFRDLGQSVVFEDIILDDFTKCLRLEERVSSQGQIKNYVRRLHIGNSNLQLLRKDLMLEPLYDNLCENRKIGAVYERAMEGIIVHSLLLGMQNVTHLSCIGNIFFGDELWSDLDYGRWRPDIALPRLTTLATRLCNITHLRLQGCDELVFAGLWQGLEHLQVVKLRHIAATGLGADFAKRDVRKLSIDQKCPFSGETLRKLLRACKCLQNVSFRRYYQDDDDDIIPDWPTYTANDVVEGLRGKDLKRIKIFDGSLDVERDEYVNILDRIVENSPNLTSARFNIELASECFFAKAKALKCAQISGEGWTVTDTKIVEMISKASPAFEKLFVRISSTVLETLEGDGNPWTYAQTERILKKAKERQIGVTVEIKGGFMSLSLLNADFSQIPINWVVFMTTRQIVQCDCFCIVVLKILFLD